MTKANKAKLKEAAALMEDALDLIVGVKMAYYNNRDSNDEFYGLEDIEVRIAGAQNDLETYTT